MTSPGFISGGATGASRRTRWRKCGFTLVELVVSVAVLSILLLVAVGILDAVQGFSSKTNSRAEQSRGGRQVLESVNSRLGQALMSPYWTIEKSSTGQPIRFARLSDLRFLTGPASVVLPAAGSSRGPGTAIFFQAPTGFSSTGETKLNAALNTWGYFVEYGSDKDLRPPFLDSLGVPEKYRFRLMEFVDPSDRLTLFRFTSGNSTYTGRQWFLDPLQSTPAYRRVVAENIVAFIALPRLPLSEDPLGSTLAPDFLYDSTSSRSNKAINPKNQLPPLVELAVVVIDEKSAARINWSSSPPDFGQSSLFLTAASLDSDLETLRANIERAGATARVYRSVVTIAAARWSTEQEN